MSNYKHGNWFCKASNEAEAVEIIERAVASGADNPRGWRGTDWANNAYGVLYGFVSFDFKFDWVDSTEYTIEQLRELFPLPGEQSKEWDGEGLPLAGTVCYIQLAFNDMGKCEITYMGDGVYCYRQLSTKREYTGSVYDTVFRRIRSEREQWVEAANALANKGGDCAASMDAIRSIYDALKSGDLKAPEVE